MRSTTQKRNQVHIYLKAAAITVIWLLGFARNANAQQGCLIGTTIYSFKTSTTWFGDPVYSSPSYGTVCANGATNQIAKTASGPNTDCVVFLFFVPFSGSVRNYTYFTCPIDSYLAWLSVSIAMVVIYRVRKYHLPQASPMIAAVPVD